MIYLLIIAVIILIIGFYFFRKELGRRVRVHFGSYNKKEDELFSVEQFTEKENIKSAKCPQCGKIATTFNEVKKYFGIRRTGYNTDAQSWCRECRRNKDEIKEDKRKKNLNLFND